MEIKTFDGDIDRLYAMMKKSWEADYRKRYNQPVQDFSPDFLRWNLEKPDSDPELQVAAYIGGKLAGFAGTIPYKASFGGKILKVALSTFFTCDEDYKRRGIGSGLALERLRRIKDRGYDINYFVQDEGHAVETLYPKLSGEIGSELRHFQRFTFLSKALDRKKILEILDIPFAQKIFLPVAAFTGSRAYDDAGMSPDCSAEKLLPLFNDIDVPALQIYWSEKELAHHLKSTLSDVFCFHKGEKRGIISYYTVDLVGNSSKGRKSAPVTMIDYVKFENMTLKEQIRMVNDFCIREKSRKICMVLLPLFPLFDPVAFAANLFFPSGRYHNIRGYDFGNFLPQHPCTNYLIFR